jgi:hypothetical protein
MDATPGEAANVELRPGATISPETVNVFQEAVSPGAAGLRLVPLGGRPAGAAIAVSVQAWVRNISYDKHLWVDLCLLGDGKQVVFAQSLPLAFHEPADGGGDFFTVGAAVPAPKAASPVTTLLYRLYCEMNGQLFTDGILHSHELPAAGKKAAAEKASAKPVTKTATKTAAKPKAAAAKTAAAPKAKAAAAPKLKAAAEPAKTRKPRTPKA